MGRLETLELPAWWVKQCNEWFEKSGLSLRELGQRLGTVIGREPFSHPVVLKYLRAQSGSIEITRAFARLQAVAPCVTVASSQEAATLASIAADVATARPELVPTLTMILESLLERPGAGR